MNRSVTKSELGLVRLASVTVAIPVIASTLIISFSKSRGYSNRDIFLLRFIDVIILTKCVFLFVKKEDEMVSSFVSRHCVYNFRGRLFSGVVDRPFKSP